MISVVVHGGAIGFVVATGAYAIEERPRPQVKIASSEAAEPVSAAPARPNEPMVREQSTAAATLLPDPILPIVEPEPEVEVVPSFIERDRSHTDTRLSRVRIVRRQQQPKELRPKQPDPVTPPPAAPAPAQVHIAASPFAANRAPDYPEHERALGLEGEVVIGVDVDRFGVVIEARLLQPSRHAGFNRAALAAVRKWRFEPGTVDGVAVAGEVAVTIEFRLRDPAK